MRQGSNSGRRPRGRTNRKQHGGGQSRTHTFDSNGPDGRVRGNARQVYEKYLTLARDATSAGDRVAAEAYYQYAEHYFRILSDSTDPQSGNRRPEERQPQLRGTDDDSSDEDDEQPEDGNGNGIGDACDLVDPPNVPGLSAWGRAVLMGFVALSGLAASIRARRVR